MNKYKWLKIVNIVAVCINLFAVALNLWAEHWWLAVANGTVAILCIMMFGLIKNLITLQNLSKLEDYKC
jgi:hypothetical protein